MRIQIQAKVKDTIEEAKNFAEAEMFLYSIKPDKDVDFIQAVIQDDEGVPIRTYYWSELYKTFVED